MVAAASGLTPSSTVVEMEALLDDSRRSTVLTFFTNLVSLTGFSVPCETDELISRSSDVSVE